MDSIVKTKSNNYNANFIKQLYSFDFFLFFTGCFKFVNKRGAYFHSHFLQNNEFFWLFLDFLISINLNNI